MLQSPLFMWHIGFYATNTFVTDKDSNLHGDKQPKNLLIGSVGSFSKLFEVRDACIGGNSETVGNPAFFPIATTEVGASDDNWE